MSQGIPVFDPIEQAFRRTLECGILSCGFAGAFCKACGHDFLVAFSCQGRAVCPSCNARRMVETAAHLVDHELPPLPLRQWVLSVPKQLRYFLHDEHGRPDDAARRIEEEELQIAHAAGTSDEGH